MKNISNEKRHKFLVATNDENVADLNLKVFLSVVNVDFKKILVNIKCSAVCHIPVNKGNSTATFLRVFLAKNRASTTFLHGNRQIFHLVCQVGKYLPINTLWFSEKYFGAINYIYQFF